LHTGPEAGESRHLVVVVEVADGDPGDDDPAFQRALADGRPVDL